MRLSQYPSAAIIMPVGESAVTINFGSTDANMKSEMRMESVHPIILFARAAMRKWGRMSREDTEMPENGEAAIREKYHGMKDQ